MTRICIFLLLTCSSFITFSQDKGDFIDINLVQPIIEDLGRQFTAEFRSMDSIALANHYTSDGMLGSIKGRENLISAWNRMIQSGIKNGTPNLLFVTNSLATDDEFIVELGKFEFVDDNGVTKNQGKYVVVWKQENGEWKIYRDNGL